MDKRVMSELEYIVQAYGYTRIDWERIRRCTREEKETLIPWVKELIAWERKYRRNGLLILEEWIQDLESPLEKLMVYRFCDCGNPPEIRSEIFYNFLCSSELDDVSYLKYALLLQFLLELWLRGYVTDTTMDKLLTSYLGREFLRQFSVLERPGQEEAVWV